MGQLPNLRDLSNFRSDYEEEPEARLRDVKVRTARHRVGCGSPTVRMHVRVFAGDWLCYGGRVC
jgi:hypothetical protein